MRVRQVILGSAIILLLAGCATNPAFPAFDREPTAADAAPSEWAMFRDDDDQYLDEESLRYVGEYEDVSLYLIESLGGPCLFIADGDNSTIACSDTGAVSTTTQSGLAFELAPAPIAEGDGWTVVSENVRVRPAPN